MIGSEQAQAIAGEAPAAVAQVTDHGASAGAGEALMPAGEAPAAVAQVDYRRALALQIGAELRALGLRLLATVDKSGPATAVLSDAAQEVATIVSGALGEATDVAELAPQLVSAAAGVVSPADVPANAGPVDIGPEDAQEARFARLEMNRIRQAVRDIARQIGNAGRTIRPSAGYDESPIGPAGEVALAMRVLPEPQRRLLRALASELLRHYRCELHLDGLDREERACLDWCRMNGAQALTD